MSHIDIIKDIFRPLEPVGIITADYTVGGKRRSATLTISRLNTVNGLRTFIERRNVTGKREARALAKRLGAQPWNF